LEHGPGRTGYRLLTLLKLIGVALSLPFDSRFSREKNFTKEMSLA